MGRGTPEGITIDVRAPGEKINFGEKSRAGLASVAKLIVAPRADSRGFTRFYKVLRRFTRFVRGFTRFYEDFTRIYADFTRIYAE